MKLIVEDVLKDKGSEIFAISPESTVYQAVDEMNIKGVGALLVMHAGIIQGIISERDYARKIILKGKSSKNTLVQEVMTRNPIYASPKQNVHECMQLMTEKRIRHLPVKEGESLLGLISIGDLVKAVIKEQQFQIDQLKQYITQ